MSEDIKEIKRISIRRLLTDSGVSFVKAGPAEFKCCCPLPDHKDTNASFYVNDDQNVFKCHGCGKSGSVIDLVMELEKLPVKAAIARLSNKEDEKEPIKVKVVPKVSKNQAPPKLTDEFIYKNETGTPVFFVKRFLDSDGGKTFRQGYINDKGVEIMSMKDVKRIPYNLHLFGAEGILWHAEGEKCAEALWSIGLTGTTTAGGSGGWLDAYSSYYKDRDVVILPDHDEPGEKYCKEVMDSLRHVAKSIRVLRLGGPGRKKGFDVADFIKELKDEFEAENDGRDSTDAVRSHLEQRANSCIPIVKGVELNISSMTDMKNMHKNSAKDSKGRTLDIANFLPSLQGVVRKLRTGDCVVLKGPTGSAKTLFAQAVARWASPMKVLVFEIELAQEDMFARWAAMENDCEINDVHKLYEKGGDVKTTGIDHIYVCPCSKPTPQYIEETIRNSELVIGERPGLVIIDYIQLVAWPERSSRYERFSNIAESFRVMPNTTRTIFIVISQVARPDSNIKGERVPSRYDSKESGSIETSATLMLDIAPGKVQTIKKITVLKDTHSSLEGQSAEVGFIGEKALFGEPFHSCSDVF